MKECFVGFSIHISELFYTFETGLPCYAHQTCSMQHKQFTTVWADMVLCTVKFV